MDRVSLCKSSSWNDENFESGSIYSTIDCQSRAYIQPDELICTKLRNRLSQENLGAFIRICKFRELTEKDFCSIMEKWLKADDTKSKKRRVSTRLSIIVFIWLSLYSSGFFVFIYQCFSSVCFNLSLDVFCTPAPNQENHG